jgi:POLQ-like helicase
MHTEGSIIFADNKLYENKEEEEWKWKQVTELLLPENSEPCGSTLLSLFDPLHSDNHKQTITNINPIDLVINYLEQDNSIFEFLADYAARNSKEKFTAEGLEKQVLEKRKIIASIESYLMTHWDEAVHDIQEDNIYRLASETFAYFSANEEQKTYLFQCFNLLAENISIQLPLASKRRAFGRTLYGVKDTLAIEKWVSDNLDKLDEAVSFEELLSVLWDVLKIYIQNTNFIKCNPPEVLASLANSWINGRPFFELLKSLQDVDAKFISKSRTQNPTIENIVDICENGLAYEGTLVLGAVIEIVGLVPNRDNEDLIRRLQGLQKQLKYGLPSIPAITLYELGFADRVIAIELSQVILVVPRRKDEAIKVIRQYQQQIQNILTRYPSYFSNKLKYLINNGNIG